MKLLILVMHELGFAVCLFVGSVNSFAQTCNDRALPATPDSRFELSGSEVYDSQTGLIWQRCSEGQQWDGTTCTGSAGYYTWPAALALTSEDWRVPNSNELFSIVETACVSPAINSNIFPNTLKTPYWSSSPYGGYSGYAWQVHFSTGNNNWGKMNYYGYVRLVRGGQ